VTPTLTDLPDVLRRAGREVSTLPGWQSRNTRDQTFNPGALVWHHDASRPGDSPGVPDYMARNYATAGAQLWVDRAGHWTVISCLKANHAGVVLGGMPGNSLSYGIETDHTTGEPWPPELLASLRIGSVAILRWLGAQANDLHFHRTVCYPVGRKSDPDVLDLRGERQALDAMWNGAVTLSQPAPALPVTPVPAPALPAVVLPGAITVDGVWGPDTTRALQRALAVGVDGVLGPQTYRALQARIGAAVDGVFGPNSRRALQRYLGVAADGVVGPVTVRALQARLSAGRF
jgi:peptidoglycan hydrolase-like protein with peptidoglycan-binding domain